MTTGIFKREEVLKIQCWTLDITQSRSAAVLAGRVNAKPVRTWVSTWPLCTGNTSPNRTHYIRGAGETNEDELFWQDTPAPGSPTGATPASSRPQPRRRGCWTSLLPPEGGPATAQGKAPPAANRRPPLGKRGRHQRQEGSAVVRSRGRIQSRGQARGDSLWLLGRRSKSRTRENAFTPTTRAGRRAGSNSIPFKCSIFNIWRAIRVKDLRRGFCHSQGLNFIIKVEALSLAQNSLICYAIRS